MGIWLAKHIIFACVGPFGIHFGFVVGSGMFSIQNVLQIKHVFNPIRLDSQTNDSFRQKNLDWERFPERRHFWLEKVKQIGIDSIKMWFGNVADKSQDLLKQHFIVGIR